jgi:hypothetical protein
MLTLLFVDMLAWTSERKFVEIILMRSVLNFLMLESSFLIFLWDSLWQFSLKLEYYDKK